MGVRRMKALGFKAPKDPSKQVDMDWWMDGLRDDTEMNQIIGLGWKDNAREMGKETSSVRVKDF